MAETSTGGATLSRWVGDVDAFMSGHWRRRPAIFDTDPPAPMDLGDVDTALATGLLREPYLNVIRAGDDIPPAMFTESREVHSEVATGFADAGAVVALLEQGATLLLLNTEQWHRPTAELVAGLARETGRRVEAFFFVTPPGRQGLPVHRDDADVLLLQVAGSKQWTVRTAPPNADWRPGPVSGEPGPVLLDAPVNRGQVLYIPRGYAHSAVGAEGLSVHLSLTIREIGAAQLVRSVPRLLFDGVTVPARPLDDAGVLESAATLLDAARSRLAGLRPEDLVRHARRMHADQKLNDVSLASLARFARSHDAGGAR
jgi:ribosomal protein L16 Arg81 hydroxylase